MTKAWKQRCNALLQQDLDQKQLMRQAEVLAREMGFEYLVYSLEAPLPVNAPRVVTRNNLPVFLTERLMAIRGKKTMPPARMARLSGMPFYWPPEHYPKEDAGYWIGMRSMGLMGVTIPAPYRVGTIASLSLGRGSGPLTLAERTANESRWLTLTRELDAALRPILEPLVLPEIDAAELTPLEREALALAAEGKTARETAKEMNETVRNVNYFRTRATAKLDAKNLMQAVTRALVLGKLTQPSALAGLNQ